MSNKYIECGPGKDIDPTDQERRDLLSLSSPRERLLFQALQQREERKDRANETIMLQHIACMKHKGHPFSDGMRHGLLKAFAALNNLTYEEAESILEGTDGE